MKKTPSTPLLDQLSAAAAPFGLITMGGLHLTDGGRPQTLVLIGTGPTFWHYFTQSPEYADHRPDPVDRWSARVLPVIARRLGAGDIQYPFGGPPYRPFISWAKATGEAFDSPVGMLVHKTAGMMISYRGALIFDKHHCLPDVSASHPCDTCPDRPCETACPVNALSPDHFYDVPTCKAHISAPEGRECVQKGCAVRRACPISARFDRPQEQSAHHMRTFLGEIK